MANAGRILILARGAWDTNISYSQLDLVTRNNLAYLARQASIGVDPSTDTSYTYWQPFGSAAQIATTSTAGLVMPDGTSITVDATGLIHAVPNVSDLSNVEISNLTDGQVLKYDVNTNKWVNVSLGTAAAKNSTNAVTSGSTDLVESGAVYTELGNKVDTSAIKNNVTTTSSGYVLDARQGKTLNDKVLCFQDQAVAATTGDFTTVSNSLITANHVVTSCVFANPSAITSDVSWATASGSVKLNGTCTNATTVTIELVRKQ